MKQNTYEIWAGLGQLVSLEFIHFLYFFQNYVV